MLSVLSSQCSQFAVASIEMDSYLNKASLTQLLIMDYNSKFSNESANDINMYNKFIVALAKLVIGKSTVLLSVNTLYKCCRTSLIHLITPRP
jgi:hypothetical protein